MCYFTTFNHAVYLCDEYGTLIERVGNLTVYLRIHRITAYEWVQYQGIPW